MDEIGLDELLQLIIKDKGGTPQQYNDLMDYIAYHETGPVDPSLPDQRMKTDAIQYKWDNQQNKWVQATGRGLFMFESHEDAGGNLASNRLANILDREGIEKPQWLIDIWEGKKSVDASKLNADQQKMLFLAYHREHPTSNFSNIWSGDQSIQDFWLKNHWAGTEGAEAKLDLFNKSMLAKDSTDALKAKEEELLLKQNMAPFLADSNNVEKLPAITRILNSIFGTKSSPLIFPLKQYNHGGVHIPWENPSGSTMDTGPSGTSYITPEVVYDDQKIDNLMPWLNLGITEELYHKTPKTTTNQEVIYPSPPKPTLWDKILNTAANPLATFGYSVRNEPIPWGNVPRHSNPFDTYALGMINPFAWAESLEASVDEFGRGNILGGTLEGLGALPVVPAGLSAGKQLASKIPPVYQRAISQNIPSSFLKEADRTLYNLLRNRKWQSTSSINKSLEDASDFTFKWHQDPITQAKLKDFNLQKIVNEKIAKGHHKTTLPTYTKWTQNYWQPGHSYGGWSMHDLADMGEKVQGWRPVNYINPIQSRTMRTKKIKQLGVHEGGTHGLYEAKPAYIKPGGGYNELGETLTKDILTPIQYMDKVPKPKNWTNLSKKQKDSWIMKNHAEKVDNYYYLSEPGEMHARINEIRINLNLSPSDKITTKQAASILDDIKAGKKYGIDPDWAKLFKNPEALKKMMNKVPLITGAIATTTLQE